MIPATIPVPPARPRVLFVDDEPAVLDAIAANLRRSFDVVTATSGAEGLQRLSEDPTISVVVSDMRMPKMDGATFLTRAKELSPNTVRMLLTGHAEINAAIEAVNHGQIFRFLTKPCPRDTLRSAIDGAVDQHRLQQLERHMLEQTVRGAVKMLFDVLALSNPIAFGRGNRIKARVLELATAMQLPASWHLEVAALSSQLVYIAVSDEIVLRAHRGESLSEDERQQLASANETAIKLLSNIPRLEPVCEVLEAYLRPRNVASTWRSATELEADLLRFAVELDELETQLGGPTDVATVRVRLGHVNADVMAAYARIRDTETSVLSKEIRLGSLRVGMVLAEDVRLANGTLLVARGYEVTANFLSRISAFPSGTMATTIKVIA